MTRSDLVEELAARFGQLTQRDAEAAVKTILDAVGDALVRGHRTVSYTHLTLPTKRIV